MTRAIPAIKEKLDLRPGFAFLPIFLSHQSHLKTVRILDGPGRELAGVFTDLDGTVWYPDEKIFFKFHLPSKFVDACKRVQERAPLFIATGRPYSSVKETLAQHGLSDIMPMLPGVYSDGHIICLKDRFIKYTMPQALLGQLVNTMDQMIEKDAESGKHWSYLLATPDGIARLESAPLTDRLKQCTSIAQVAVSVHSNLKAFFDAKKEAMYFAIIGPDGASIAERLRKSLPNPDAFVYRQGHTNWITEFVQKGVSKGSGVQKLCAYLKLDTEKVAVIGDDHNDLEMIKAFKHSAAIGSAPDSVKAEASLVVKSAKENGWAEAIEKFMAEQKS